MYDGANLKRITGFGYICVSLTSKSTELYYRVAHKYQYVHKYSVNQKYSGCHGHIFLVMRDSIN